MTQRPPAPQPSLGAEAGERAPLPRPAQDLDTELRYRGRSTYRTPELNHQTEESSVIGASWPATSRAALTWAGAALMIPIVGRGQRSVLVGADSCF